MSPGLIQACNATSLSQLDTNPSTNHTHFSFSTNIPVQPQHPEANINGDAGVTWEMSVIKAGQIDERRLHTVEDDKPRAMENDDQYVVWNCSQFSLIRRCRSGHVVINTPAPTERYQEIYQSAGLIHQTSTSSIPKCVDQPRHLRPPTEVSAHPTPVSDVDTDWAPSLQDAPAGLIRQQASSRKRRSALQRVYDKPGTKPAVAYEPNLPRLQELSRQRGGRDFAIAWISKAFTRGVNADALRRTLSEDEINAVDHDHGFRLSQTYDGFLEKVEDRFECGLCAEGKRANWKNKKDAIRHFQKFHFGIGQTCGTW